MLGVCGILISVSGAMLLPSLSNLGVPPFGEVKRNEFTDIFIDLRTFAYAVIAFGIILTVGACIAWWRRKR